MYKRVITFALYAKAEGRVHVCVFARVRVTDCDKPSKRVSTVTANIMQNLTSL